MTVKDGGSAFPEVTTELAFDREATDQHYANTYSYGGMSLRDYFAGQALAGILASPQLDVHKPAPELAKNCLAIADAMLKALEEQP